MSITPEQEEQAKTEINNISDARKEGDKAKETTALENLKKLFLSIGKVEDAKEIGRISNIRDAFNALLQQFHIEDEKAYAVIKLMIEIHCLLLNDNGAAKVILYRAAVLGDMDCFQRLLIKTYQYDIDMPLNVTQDTALHVAAYEGQINAVRFLVAQGANIHIKNVAGETPLIAAVQGNAMEIVEYFLTQGADVNEKNSFGGATPLHEAAGRSEVCVDMLRMLIEHKADGTIETQRGWTALYLAVDLGVIEKIRLLLENGGRVIDSRNFRIGGDNRKEMAALLDDYGLTDHSEIDYFFDKLLLSIICRESQSALSKGNPVTSEDVNNIIADYGSLLSKAEKKSASGGAGQQGQAISRIQYVKEKLKNLIKWRAAEIITLEEQTEFKNALIAALRSDTLREECGAYWQQLRTAQIRVQNLDTVVPPWELFRVVPKDILPAESKEHKRDRPLAISDAKELPAGVSDTKAMPIATSVSSADQTRRDNEVSSNAAAMRMPGVGFNFNAGKEAEAKPSNPDAPQKAEGETPPQQGSDAGSSNDPKSGLG